MFEDRKIDVLSVRVFKGNITSQILVEKLGFKNEGCIRQGVKGYNDIIYDDMIFSIMKMGFNPTRANVENYIGWGSENEPPLPASIIKQFTISVMNVNPNSAFPKMINKSQLKRLTMPVFVMLGEKEFAFNIHKANNVALENISDLTIDIIKEASHLICVSKPEETNKKILKFLNDEQS